MGDRFRGRGSATGVLPKLDVWLENGAYRAAGQPVSIGLDGSAVMRRSAQ